MGIVVTVGMLRIVQIGSGQPRHLVLLFLVGESANHHLRQALGPKPCILADDKANDPRDISGFVAEAERLCGVSIAGYVVGGWSAGVSKVRAMLGEECDPMALVLADGTHASKPPRAEQIEVWQPYVERGRAGKMVFVASHIFNTYVESLPSPYLSTVSTLRLLTGWPLGYGGTVETPIEQHDGELHVYSYTSSACDAPAHGAQLNHALPMMLARHVRPLFDTASAAVPVDLVGMGGRILRVGMGGSDVAVWQAWLAAHGFYGHDQTGQFDESTRRSTIWFQHAARLETDGVVGPKTLNAAHEWKWPSVLDLDGTPLWHDPKLSHGARAVRWSLAWLGRDMETDGPNNGPLIVAMFSPAMRRVTNKPIDVRSGEWCAAFFSCASHAALLEDQPLSSIPHTYRVSVIELRQDAEAAGCWLSAAEVRNDITLLCEGDGMVLSRGSGWEGHIVRVLLIDEGRREAWVVGGNELDMVRISRVSISDPTFQGVITMPGNVLGPALLS